MSKHEILNRMLRAAISSAQPETCIPPGLPESVAGRLVVVGAGKAAAAMARAVEANWRGPLSGVVITRYGHAVPCERIRVIEAAHPLPDSAGLDGARRVLDQVRGLTRKDMVLCLLSGGGSALLPLPLPGLTLEDKRTVISQLLRSGASISEMNCVRRHMSAIKGGRLAKACYPAQVLTLAISDVPGDDPIDIASGPTVADETTCYDALRIAEKYEINLPAPLYRLLESGEAESVKPDDIEISRARTLIVATPQDAVEAAAAVANANGYRPILLGDAIEGEAREAGKFMAAVARSVATHGYPLPAPCALVSGGELTVTLQGEGRGGPNVEFLLSLAVALRGDRNIWAIAADTDGSDGTEDVAGAIITPDTLRRAAKLQLAAGDFLASNDAHSFFAALGDQVITGPTKTNVNDFRAILVCK